MRSETLDGQEVVIRPPEGWSDLGLSELWAHRELLYFLVKRELQVRYKQSVVGVGWAVIQPVALAFIFALFFGRLAGVPSNGVPYPLFALAGLVPWMFVSQATVQSALSLVGDANLLAKVYFPRLVLPAAKILALGMDLVVSLVVLLVFGLAYGISFQPELLLLPSFLLLGMLLALGVGVFLSAMNVKYRDVAVVVPLTVQVWLFATPVIYPGTLIEGGWRYLYALNPMVTVVEGVRWALLGTPAPDLGPALVSVGMTLIVLAFGGAYFRRTERFFADLI